MINQELLASLNDKQTGTYKTTGLALLVTALLEFFVITLIKKFVT